MAPFYPLYIRRSDGKLEVASGQRKREKNEPTAEQLDRTPDAKGVSDFYRQVVSDEVKNIDWRRKLGGMLARELIKGKSLGLFMQLSHVGHHRLINCKKRTIFSMTFLRIIVYSNMSNQRHWIRMANLKSL